MLAASLDLSGRGRGLILEKTAKPGSKLLMSGGGRCNITHGGSIKDFVNAYGDAGLKLRKCLYRHSNTELVSWLEEHGISVTDEGGRIFPASFRSSDALRAFTSQARSNGWEIKTGEDVTCIAHSDESGNAPGFWTIVTRSGSSYETGRLVIASGGITYPETGSDGSMFPVLEDLGLDIEPLRPALTPVYVRDYPYEELSGVSLPDVEVTAFSSDAAFTCKGKAARMRGDLLFTHRGFSGPVILNISRYACPGQVIRIRYLRDLDELPRSMQRILKDRSRGPSGDVRTTRLAALLDADDFVVSSVDSRGMVTAGGISLEEIDMSSMQIDPDLAGAPGLYAIGEAIDADGITGGYNLQMCWSTARTAADAISQSL